MIRMARLPVPHSDIWKSSAPRSVRNISIQPFSFVVIARVIVVRPSESITSKPEIMQCTIFQHLPKPVHADLGFWNTSLLLVAHEDLIKIPHAEPRSPSSRVQSAQSFP